MKKFLQNVSAALVLLMISGGSVKAQVYHFQEGFMTNAPPVGWLTTNVAWSSNYNHGLYPGDYSAKLKPNESFLMIKVMNTADVLQFYIQVRDTTVVDDFHLMIEKSYDKLTWVEIAKDPCNMKDSVWQLVNITVADNAPELYVRFHATALGGTATLGLCYIDDISVTKLEVSPSDATLTDFTYNGTTVEGFTAATLEYEVEVPYYVDQVIMGGTPNNPNASLTITNPSNMRGSETERTGKVKVTSQDGTATKTYQILFTVSKYIYKTGFPVSGNPMVPFPGWTTAYTLVATILPMGDHGLFPGVYAFKFVRGQPDKIGYLNTTKYVKSDTLSFWLAVDQSDGFEKMLVEKRVSGGVRQTIANIVATDMSPDWKEFKYAIKEDDSTEIIFTPTITTESLVTRIFMDDLSLTGKPVPQGIQKVPAGLNMTIYPNPAQNFITIKVNNPDYSYIDIYDATGNNIFSASVSGPGLTIDTRTYSNGIYFVTCRGKNSICTGKFIKN